MRDGKLLSFSKLSAKRVESFSDAFIAIIITLMALELIPPQNINLTELLTLGKSIILYFASFVIVGTQWTKHHILMNEMEFVSQRFVWKNMISLFFISLIPVFMKWLLEYPVSVLPAIAYSMIYIVNEVCLRWTFKESMEVHKTISLERDNSKYSFFQKAMMFIFIGVFVLLLALSAFYPEIAIICFVVLPVVMSLLNILVEK
ncbi:TMEM175 family protein [Clostridioides difficile]|uniref:TMEM175 family protein n=1 Tax=Clostridioides difficile TaxID=1496 RepID=UPI000C99CFDE|nr:TMEM175 family protein [Clostridioides difficile]MDI3075032.1 TMEM175 family protein [Clostridioides difficile]MDK3169076.1 TMEM175 family protein [Clostridioides difficile]NMU16714.1 DUF1211 domain-containing protein [Clostridioides difficile]